MESCGAQKTIRHTVPVPSVFGLPAVEMVEMAVSNDLRSVKGPEDFIIQELEKATYTKDTIFAVKLALEEALTNAVKHGNANNPNKQVTIAAHIDTKLVLIMVRDEGPGFQLHEVPDCTAEENLERPSGRGIMLMHAYMTQVWFNDAGNEVWLMRLNAAS